MKIAKQRRERLFARGKPVIRPAVFEDVKWMWVQARVEGYDGDKEEFLKSATQILSGADKVFVLEDRNSDFDSGKGPVGIVMANYDGWALAPHVEWFSWATKQNILRCTVGFLQMMRYNNSVGVIKITANTEHQEWFKRLKRYVQISFSGRVKGGRRDGDECIFYLKGRQHHGISRQIHQRGQQVLAEVQLPTDNNSSTSGHYAQH